MPGQSIPSAFLALLKLYQLSVHRWVVNVYQQQIVENESLCENTTGPVTPKSQINTWTLSPSLSRESCPLCLSLSTSIFHPSIINPPHTPPADLVGSPVFVRWAPRVCVCSSSLVLISLGCCHFKLFIPTTPALAHTHISITCLPASARPRGGRRGNLIKDRRFQLEKWNKRGNWLH